MTVKQQKKQMCLAFPAEGRGEAPSAVGKGTEAVRAGDETESQASPENIRVIAQSICSESAHPLGIDDADSTPGGIQ